MARLWQFCVPRRRERLVMIILGFIILATMYYAFDGGRARGPTQVGYVKRHRNVPSAKMIPSVMSHTIPDYSKPRFGPGENGTGVHLEGKEKEEGEKQKKTWFMNVVASDKISMDRNIPDSRSQQCKDVVYDVDLPSASVVIIFTDEAWSPLLRTVHSVINRSPPRLLHEVVLLDDFSQRDELKGKLDEYVKRFGGLVKIVRWNERLGLIRAKLEGAKVATGEVVVFLDSHCEANAGWLEPLLQRIKNKRTAVVCPIIDSISDYNMAYNGGYIGGIGTFWWSLHFKMDPIPPKEVERRKNNPETEPLMSPTMAGGLLAANREYFFEVGGYDPGMDIWGGENLEISFRVWMCGGSIEFIPCSHVGHIFRAGHPYNMTGRGGNLDVHGTNSKRLAEVWMDDYKRLYYVHRMGLVDTDVGAAVSSDFRFCLCGRLVPRTMNATGETVHLQLSISNYPYPSHDELRLVAYSLGHAGEIEVYQSEPFPSSHVGFTFHKDLVRSYRFSAVHQLLRFVLHLVGQNGMLVEVAETRIDLHDIIIAGGLCTLPFVRIDPQMGSQRFGKCDLTIQVDISSVRRRATLLMFGGNSLSSLSRQTVAPYFVLNLVEGTEHNQQRKIVLYRSENVQGESNPRWKEFIVPAKFFEIYPTAYLEVQCYNYNVNAPDTLIGRFSTKYGQLLHGVGSINKYMLTSEDRLKKENMDIELIKIEANHTFNDITNILTTRRTQLFLTVGIDFTANNGSPNVPTSLHYLHPHMGNPYSDALSTVAQGFYRFDKFKRLSAFGFGAKRENKLQQKFPIHIKGSQYVDGSQGLVEHYRQTLMNVLPFAPTDYSEVIYHVLTLAKAAVKNKGNPLEFYFLLAIFTNGNLKEEQATVNALVEASYFPISVVFVPVYNQTHPMCGGDSMRLKRLLSPTLKMKAGTGLKRQMVSLIDEQLTPEAVLADVPRHLEQWTLLNNC